MWALGFIFRYQKSTLRENPFPGGYELSSLDKSKPTIAVFIDLAKAFDTVNHELLLDKLEKYGIRGSVLDLIKSYLTNRQQKVRIKDANSNTRIIDTGVPQGTILWPLFSFYCHHLWWWNMVSSTG